MKFEARIEGSLIRCTVTPDRDLAAPVFCFSSMVPSVSVDGLARLKSIGGYSEIQLPDVQADQAFDFDLAYENAEFSPANRAWLPLGAYLRSGDEIFPLPALQPAGVQQGSVVYDQGVTPELLVCPQPALYELNGEMLQVSGIRSDAPDMQRVDELTKRSGLGSLLSNQGVPLAIEIDTSLPSEAYRLEIGHDSLKLAHSDDAGAFYGGITLATLIENHNGQIPCGTIHDNPRFEWRGQHLDCARHFYQVDTILRLLDLMSMLKMNRFHWHFADDEAFRLELDALPELSQTHFRGEEELVPGVFGGGSRSGGSYSQEDAKLIIAHAASLNIEVMPEIEVPAHALALCKVYPETRDKNDTGNEQSVQGYFENAMNPAMSESWRIWETMVDEIGGLFPFEMLHLGGDELPHNTWQGSPAAKSLMRSEGLETTQDLQGWTMNKLAQHTVSTGKVPAGWEESALGSKPIGNDAVIFCWTGQGPGLQAARDGHRVVMMPGQKTYLDMAQTNSPDDWGAIWAAKISLEETINWDPVPDDEPEIEDNIIGVEGALWSEFTTIDAEMEPMIAPRILGIASMGWQPKTSKNVDTLLGLRAAYADLFTKVGWAQT